MGYLLRSLCLDIVHLFAPELKMSYFATRVAGLVALAIGVAALLSSRALAQTTVPALPTPDHIVVTIEENHGFPQIIDDEDAPFIQDLARRGALFTQSFALLHPSQPNYLALFSGSTHGVVDDGRHSLDGPTLAGVLASRGRTFLGYVEAGSPRKHNPWETFRHVKDVERRLSDFPNDLTRLPTVSFVIPNNQNNMHDGSIEQGDRWLHQNLGRYADWCVTHNSLFILTVRRRQRPLEESHRDHFRWREGGPRPLQPADRPLQCAQYDPRALRPPAAGADHLCRADHWHLAELARCWS